MTDLDKRMGRPGPEDPPHVKRLGTDADRAAELVRQVTGERHEPFGRLSLVRAVVRPQKRSSG